MYLRMCVTRVQRRYTCVQLRMRVTRVTVHVSIDTNAHACKYTSEHKVVVVLLFTLIVLRSQKYVSRNNVATYCKKEGWVTNHKAL